MNTQNFTKQQKKPITALGFDFGMKKIGVASGQSLTCTATPLTILSAKAGIPCAQQLNLLKSEWAIDVLVVGLPYAKDGSMQPITFAARKFGRRLSYFFKKPVYFIDERFTTLCAKQESSTKTSVDCYAAKLILESWLRENYYAK